MLLCFAFRVFTSLFYFAFNSRQDSLYVCVVSHLDNTAMGTRACARVVLTGGCPLLLSGSFARL